MAVSLRRGGVGNLIRIGHPEFFVQRKRSDSPLDVELMMAKSVLSRVLPKKSSVDSLILVGSLPRVHRSILGASLASSCDGSFGAVLEFSGGCASILDAMHYIFCCASPDDSHALVVVDSFASSYQASSGGMDWSDGAAAMHVSPAGPIKLKLVAYASSHRAEYLDMAHAYGGELGIPLVPRAVENFSSADVGAIRDLLKAALDFSGLALGDLSCVILPNRSGLALDRVESVLGGAVRVFESRVVHSHSGGSDVLINLSAALNDIHNGFFCLVGFSLGYSWRVMILEILE